MAKVNFTQTSSEVFFNSFAIGRYFIYFDKLFLKVSEHRAFDFEEDVFVTVGENTKVTTKLGNDIEITVK